MPRLPTLTTLALLLAACATAPTDKGEAPADNTNSPKSDMALSIEQNIRVERSGETVVYRGRLTEQGLDALRNAGDDPQVTTLLIESSGGEIVVGMDFGNWVVERELNLVIDYACLSSCANYVFTAGRQ